MKRHREEPGAAEGLRRQGGSGYRGGGSSAPLHSEAQDRAGNHGLRLTTNDALSYLRDVKARFADNKETYDTFLEIMKKFKASRINTDGVIDQVKSLFRGHKELILGFNTFLPKGFEITLPPTTPEEEPKAAVEFDQAITYVNKIKTRFAHDERVYKAFLEILNMYRKGTKTIADVYHEVSVLFQTHDDLLQEFTYFLPESQHVAKEAQRKKEVPNRGRGLAREGDGGRPGRPGRALNLDKELQWFEKVKQRLRGREAYQEFLKLLNLYSSDVISRQELVVMGQEFLSARASVDISHQFESSLNRLEVAEYDQDNIKQRAPARESRRGQPEKFGTRPVSDMDVSTWERAMTSYVKLPKGYPKLRASHMTVIGQAVLQDDWVSVTSGSEDYSFKHMRKNQYEEALFRCEDDKFELDMALECCRSAVRAFTKVSLIISQLPQDQRENFRLSQDMLAPIHYRIVQKIYGILPGERGGEMVDILRKNPAVVVDVCLGRLHQKVGEWEKDQARMGEIWQKMYDTNYHKSLDHRSFYFKQTDKRNLGQKVMLQEIKDVAEKRKTEDDNVQLSAVSRGLRLAPDLTFNFRAVVVHEDLRRIIKYSLDEMLSPEVSDKALEMWTTVIEPLFGLVLQPIKSQPKAKEASASVESLETRINNEENSAEQGNASNEPSALDKPETEAASMLDAIGKVASSRINEREASEDRAENDAQSEDGREATPAPKTEASSPDESSNEAFGNCMPILPSSVQQGILTAERPPCGRVLYGNEHFYTLFRLHQHLFDRLRTARRCSLHVTDPSARQMSEEQQDQQVASLPPAADAVHKEFLGLAFKVIDGQLDSSAYEDLCRSLLGTNSYTLFTLDKLIYKIVKQIQHILSEETSLKLLDLYNYERSRRMAVMDSIYYQNAHVILHEDMTFRFELKQPGDFTMQLLDQDRSEVPIGVYPPDFEEAVQTFLHQPAVVGRQALQNPRLRRPYLKRSLAAISEQHHEDEQMKALEGTKLQNGLECKIMTRNSKVTYVLDTEDYFKRPHKRPRTSPEGLDLQRRRRFASWLQGVVAHRLQAQSAEPIITDTHMPLQPAPLA